MVITDRTGPATEHDILERARARDAQAFWLLTEPLQARLLRQATALSGDLTAAEDLVSEALVQAWQSLPRYREQCRFSTWLYSILLHRWHKSIRRARSRPLSLAWLPFVRERELDQRQQNIPSPEASPADAVGRNELFAQVRRCVEALPDKHREIICLHSNGPRICLHSKQPIASDWPRASLRQYGRYGLRTRTLQVSPRPVPRTPGPTDTGLHGNCSHRSG